MVFVVAQLLGRGATRVIERILSPNAPTPDMWHAYGQASIGMAREIVNVLVTSGVYVFASMIPKGSARRPADVDGEFVRKDLTRVERGLRIGLPRGHHQSIFSFFRPDA
jgi:hypothetical protein